MSVINGYVTRKDFLRWVTPQDTTADAIDDAVIDSIIEAASRYIDYETNHAYYPRVEDRLYSIPDDRELEFDDDLLSIITFTNGNDVEIASTEYNLFPRNSTPHIGLKLKDTSAIYWETDSDGSREWVISVLAELGYHNQYAQRAWVSSGTLGAEISDETTLDFTMTAGHSVSAHKIIKIDNEIFMVDGVDTNTITPLSRGDNGSTAATHANSATVYVWEVIPDIAQAAKLIAQSIYRRFGHPNQSDESIVTASGVVITPKDVPGIAARTIKRYKRRT